MEMIKVLSLGAGVQSSAVLLMSCVGELEPIDMAIFADTGWEPRAVYEHLSWLELFARDHGIPVHRVSSGKNIKEDMLRATVNDTSCGSYSNMPLFTIDEDGSLGMIRRQCTRDYKIRPITQFIREHIRPPRKKSKGMTPIVENWFGISLDEARRMRHAKEWWAVNHYPLIDIGMTRDDCLYWMEDHGFPKPTRSACIVCPYKSNTEWRHLKETSPEEWQEAVEFDHAIRDRGGMKGKLYSHQDRVPLDEVDLTTPEDHGQMTLWEREECAGMCGV